MSIPKVGKIFQDRYLILEEIGAGGMGLVYHARQLDSNREVALKLIRREKVQEDESLARFYREFQLLSRLSHPNIVLVYALGRDESMHPFAVCEYLEGKSLRSLLFAEPVLPWERACKIAIQIAAAMQYIHDNGILHRDLKPDNVILQDSPSPDFVKLVDFGLSAEFISPVSAQKLTWTGQLVGSALYMSPEQATAKADKRSDIYALGCVLFEMLAGEVLFSADTSTGAMYRHCHEDPAPRFASIGNKVPARLLELLSRILAKEPLQRYQTMNEVEQELRSIMAQPETLLLGKGYIARSEPAAPPPIVLVSACSFVVLALAFLGFGYWQRQSQQLPFSASNRSQKGTGHDAHLTLSELEALAVACENTSQNSSVSGIERLESLRDQIMSRLQNNKSLSEKTRLEAILPSVLVELAGAQVACGQMQSAYWTIAMAKRSLRKNERVQVLEQYYTLHALVALDADEVEDDLKHATEFVENQNENQKFRAGIFAANRLMTLGRFEKAQAYIDRAITLVEQSPNQKPLMIGVAFKITILKHLKLDSESEEFHKKLIELIANEKRPSVILDQNKLVYQLGAWETAELLLEDSIACLNKLGAEKMQAVPACTYMLAHVQAQLGKTAAAISALDSILSMYDRAGKSDKSGPLVGVPAREIVSQQRRGLVAKL